MMHAFAYLSSQWQVHFFIGIRPYFLRILAYTVDQLRHPASWDEQLLGWLNFSLLTATVELAEP